jgi:hypothetical protein
MEFIAWFVIGFVCIIIAWGLYDMKCRPAATPPPEYEEGPVPKYIEHETSLQCM